MEAFITAARASGRPCQIAFRAGDPDTGRGGDPSIVRHALQLSTGFTRRDAAECLLDGARTTESVYVADLYYFPAQRRDDPIPLVIDTDSHEMGYYHIPSYMASQGDLTFQIPIRAFYRSKIGCISLWPIL